MWRANAIRLYRLHARIDNLWVDPGAEVSEHAKIAADRLVDILRSRFLVFLKQRIKEKSRREHWSMVFANRNLPVVAAVLVLSGHVKTDLECLHDGDSLLVTDCSGYVKCCDCPDHEGAYLYFDTLRQVFVRSGKVAGRGFLERNNDHVKGSKEARPSSAFYRYYPSKQSDRATRKRRGQFESLVQVIAAGFDPKSEEMATVDQNYDKGGILILNACEERAIGLSMKNLNCSTKDKFKHMLAYLVELGYDLSLAPGDVVSINPGFESVLGVF